MTTTETTTKKGFDFSRNSIYVADPDDLTIVGGRGVLVGDEYGSHDVGAQADDDLEDDARLREPLTDEFVNSVDAFGVLEPVLIAKVDDRAVVVAGRRRVRGARVVNRRRKAQGLPPLKVECKVVKQKGVGLTAVMILENEGRKNDGILDKIAKARRLISRGVSLADIAVIFNTAEKTLEEWLAYDEHATEDLRKQVEAGAMSFTAGRQLARVKNPDKQREAVAKMLATPTRTASAAAKAARQVTGRKDVDVGLSQRKQVKALLNRVVEAGDKRAAHDGGSAAFWEGVEATLKAVLGEGDLDVRIKQVMGVDEEKF